MLDEMKKQEAANVALETIEKIQEELKFLKFYACDCLQKKQDEYQLSILYNAIVCATNIQVSAKIAYEKFLEMFGEIEQESEAAE